LFTSNPISKQIRQVLIQHYSFAIKKYANLKDAPITLMQFCRQERDSNTTITFLKPQAKQSPVSTITS